MRYLLSAAMLALALPGAASAVTVRADWGLSGSALTGAGLEIRTSRDAGRFAVDLEDGAESSFRLFRLWTDESDVGRDDHVAGELLASFVMAASGRGGGIAGTSRGHDDHGFQWGSVDWTAPLELDLGGGTLSILLSNESFSRGFLSLRTGRRHGTDVFARVSYASNTAASPVPLPGALPLALAGLGLLGLLRLRRPPAPGSLVSW